MSGSSPEAARAASRPRVALRAVVAPLTSGATVRAGVFLVVGGLVAGAYGLLIEGFAQMFADPRTATPTTAALAVVATTLAVAPPFLAPVRTVEVLAARTLLDVDVQTPSDRPRPAARWRGAAWFALHLVLGLVVVVSLLVVVPLVLDLLLSVVGTRSAVEPGWLPAWLAHPPVRLLLAVLVVVALPYVVVGARAVLRSAAPVLLGPDQSERIAELEAQTARLVARNRLAQDVHDGVGHALTITVLQAAAAARTVESDPVATRRSLAAIEETGRHAMAELDDLLRRLRSPGSVPLPERETSLEDDDLTTLVERARQAGADVTLDLVGDVGRAPDEVVREVYRVAQESLTNALRHAPGAPVAVRVVRSTDFGIEVRNPLPPGPRVAEERRGHGLAGMRERVTALGGTLVAGPDGGAWVVRASWPVVADEPGTRGTSS
ncbi:sensor histidine kinase [Oerskovia jenensis]|uniref:histidine kinase n=1 Tax=Oerskovia jenensis TaxID=162169 RepID=A0ABS2LFR3_9CELL|nr:histidine kinase [Oerskovia jenensis]MBM7479217.1 signal transduction histidine kinase [Oerskovia jenensis]